MTEDACKELLDAVLAEPERQLREHRLQLMIDGVVETVATSGGRRRVRGQSWSSPRTEPHKDCSRDFRNVIFYVMRKVLKYCLDSRDPVTS